MKQVVYYSLGTRNFTMLFKISHTNMPCIKVRQTCPVSKSDKHALYQSQTNMPCIKVRQTCPVSRSDKHALYQSETNMPCIKVRQTCPVATSD